MFAMRGVTSVIRRAVAVHKKSVTILLFNLIGKPLEEIWVLADLVNTWAASWLDHSFSRWLWVSIVPNIGRYILLVCWILILFPREVKCSLEVSVLNRLNIMLDKPSVELATVRRRNASPSNGYSFFFYSITASRKDQNFCDTRTFSNVDRGDEIREYFASFDCCQCCKSLSFSLQLNFNCLVLAMANLVIIQLSFISIYAYSSFSSTGFQNGCKKILATTVFTCSVIDELLK